MGFPSLGCSIEIPEPLVHILELLDFVLLMFRLALFYLGLFDPTNQAPPSSDDYRNGLSASNQPSPPTSSKLIKSRLRTVEFDKFLQRSGRCRDESNQLVCSVCLNSLEGKSRIRELCNCSHVFHAECLDKWVDQGKNTCPMCRSMLLPEGHGSRGNYWRVLERISDPFL